MKGNKEEEEKMKKFYEYVRRLPIGDRTEVMNKLSDEEILLLSRLKNPYRQPSYPVSNKFLEFSYINMPQDYMEKFTFTTLIGFLYKMAYEYAPKFNKEYKSEDDNDFAMLLNRRMREYTIRQFGEHYKKLSEANPTHQTIAVAKRAKTIMYSKLLEFKQKELEDGKLYYTHNFPPSKNELTVDEELVVTQKVVSELEEEARDYCSKNGIKYEAAFPSDISPNLEELDDLRADVKREMGITKTLQDKQRKRQDDMLDFLDYYLKYDPNHHIRCGYAPDYDELLQAKMKQNPEKYKHIKYEVPLIGQDEGSTKPKINTMVITENFEEYLVPPLDTFHALHLYKKNNYEALRHCTNSLYGDTSTFENVILPREVFNDEKKAMEWEDKYKNDFDMTVSRVNFGSWSYIDDWKKNSTNIRFDDDKAKLVKAIIEHKQKEEEMGRDLLKKKAKKMPGRVENKDLPFETQVKEMGGERYTNEEMIEGKVIGTKLLRSRRMKFGMETKSFEIEPEAPKN